MGVDFDFSDVNSFLEEEMWRVQKKMIDIGDEGIEYAEEYGNYQDHTLTLRTSNDFDIDDEGILLKNEAKSPEGYNYASDVESKGYEVLSGAALYVEKRAKEEFER